MEFELIRRPTVAQFATAAEVCEIRWSFLRKCHTVQRFEAYQKLGVELVVVRDGDRFDGVCFVLPCRLSTAGQQLEWVSLFQLATRPETKNLGAMLLMRIMSNYPAVMGMGVTAEAEQLYKALHWKCYSDVWRGVHPIDLRQIITDYNGRLSAGWQRIGLRAVAGMYNVLSTPFESLLAFQAQCRKLEAPELEEQMPADKTRTIASYLDLYLSNDSLRVVNAAGVGRVLNTARSGLGSLSDHAGAWRQLRHSGVKFCEVLVASPKAKSQALRLGYLPIRMPLWYREKNNMISLLVEALKRDEVSFLHTDKSV